MTEFELKFQVDAQQRAAVEAAVARGHSQRTHLQARYFDTPDGALAARSIVLRLRKEGPHWVQTAKAPGAHALQRHEHNVDLTDAAPLPRLDRHEGTPVGKLIAKALKKAGHDPANIQWVALHDTDIWRTTRLMRTGDAQVELAFDLGELRAGARSRPVCELEIELKQGSPLELLDLARRWRARYALWLDTLSKSERAAQLAQGAAHGAPTKARKPTLHAGASGQEVFRGVLEACLAQILPNASELAAGSDDAEHAHQLRVGIRRLRTALRELAEFAPVVDATWEPALIDAFRALGRQRDRELLEQVVQPQLAHAGAPDVSFEADTTDADDGDPAAAVRAPAFQNTLMGLVAAALPEQPEAAVESEDAQPEAARVDPRKILQKRLAKLHAQVVRDGKIFQKLSTDEQHRVRKRLKRLRYLAEFVASQFDEGRAARYLDKLEPAQDALGHHNDTATAIAAYREAAAKDGRAWFAVGWLGAGLAASANDCRRALEQVARAPRFWKSSKK